MATTTGTSSLALHGNRPAPKDAQIGIRPPFPRSFAQEEQLLEIAATDPATWAKIKQHAADRLPKAVNKEGELYALLRREAVLQAATAILRGLS